MRQTMKRRIPSFLLAALVIGALAPRPAAAETGVSISFFYDELSPYGRWETVGRYGDCWIPSGVAADWQPYTDGEWIYTDYGWTWVSYDRWGGDPYHYGTWAWESGVGWVWVPGTVWGPAWVTWSYSDAYVGWAPIPPSLEISFSGYAGPAVNVAQSSFVFVPVNRFAGVRVNTARLPVRENATLFQRTRRLTSFSVSNGIVVNRGPSVQRIEAAAHTRIPRASIDEAKSRPVSIRAGGAAPRGRLPVVASAQARSRELSQHGVGGRAAAPSPKAAPRTGRSAEPRREAAPKTRHEAAPTPREKAAPEHRTNGRAAPSEHPKKETPPPRREATPRHEAPPPKRESAPPAHREAPPKRAAPSPRKEAPPPKRENPPPERREAPPPRHEETPPPPAHASARAEAPPPRREAPPPGRAASPERRPAPPKKEPPPPPSAE